MYVVPVSEKLYVHSNVQRLYIFSLSIWVKSESDLMMTTMDLDSQA